MRATFTIVPLAGVLLTGCSWFQDIEDAFQDVQETVEDLTNPTVVQGVVLGVEEPEEGTVDLSQIDVDIGTGFTMFVASAAEVSDLENAPIEGATVSLKGNKKVVAQDDGDGVYTIEPPSELVYNVGASWTASVDSPEVKETGTISVTLPEATTMTVGEVWEPNKGMSLDFRNQGFDSALIMVYDAQNGELTWDNRPETISEIYEVTNSQEKVGIVEVPGSAFPRESLYVMGVTGMVNAKNSDIDGMNSLLSGLMAGKMKLFPIATIPGFDTDSWDTDIPFDTDVKWDTDFQFP